MWEKLGQHKNIVELYDYMTVNEDGAKFALILMEFCPDGHLLDLLEKYDGQLTEKQIISVMT